MIIDPREEVKKAVDENVALIKKQSLVMDRAIESGMPRAEAMRRFDTVVDEHWHTVTVPKLSVLAKMYNGMPEPDWMKPRTSK